MQLGKTLRTQVRLALSDQNKCRHHKKAETPFFKITVVSIQTMRRLPATRAASAFSTAALASRTAAGLGFLAAYW